MSKYVMWGSYCDNVLEARSPYRQEHLEGIKAQHESGVLLTLGPTKDTTKVFGIYEAEDEATVRKLVEGDPYWQNGIWTEYEVKEWVQVFPAA
ncbi:MAG: YciI family protein [Spirulinaceae cyanobacterium]